MKDKTLDLANNVETAASLARQIDQLCRRGERGMAAAMLYDLEACLASLARKAGRIRREEGEYLPLSRLHGQVNRQE